MKTLSRRSILTAVVLMLAVLTPSVSHAAKTHITEVSRLSSPPEGKALVNIHRIGGMGPFGADIRIPIFDESGKFLMDLPRKSECQFVFEPGPKTLITWFQANPVNIVTVDLAPNKTYDIVFDASMGIMPFFVPLSQAPHKLQDLKKLEGKLAPKVYALERDEVALAFEASQKAHIEQIKADFIGGKKSDRVIQVNKDDCR
jgi:hypothetical protein